VRGQAILKSAVAVPCQTMSALLFAKPHGLLASPTFTDHGPSLIPMFPGFLRVRQPLACHCCMRVIGGRALGRVSQSPVIDPRACYGDGLA